MKQWVMLGAGAATVGSAHSFGFNEWLELAIALLGVILAARSKAITAPDDRR